MGCDPKLIVSEYRKFKTLTKANEKLGTKLQESEKLLQHYRRKLDEVESRWKGHADALEIINRLATDGLLDEDIFRAVNILKNDFPRTKINELIEDIRTYGSISAAKAKLEREYEAKIELLDADNDE